MQLILLQNISLTLKKHFPKILEQLHTCGTLFYVLMMSNSVNSQISKKWSSKSGFFCWITTTTKKKAQTSKQRLVLFDILIICITKKNWAFWQSKHFGWKNRWLWGFMGKRRVFPLSVSFNFSIFFSLFN